MVVCIHRAAFPPTHWAFPPTLWACAHCHQRSLHQSLARPVTGYQSPVNSQVAIGTCMVTQCMTLTTWQRYWSYFVSPQILSHLTTIALTPWQRGMTTPSSTACFPHPQLCFCQPHLLCQSQGSQFQVFYMRSTSFTQVCTHLTSLQ